MREHQAVRRTYEQTFMCKYVDKISERNYYGEKFDGVTVYVNGINKTEYKNFEPSIIQDRQAPRRHYY